MSIAMLKTIRTTTITVNMSKFHTGPDYKAREMHSQSQFSESSGIGLLWGFLATEPFPNHRKNVTLWPRNGGEQYVQ
jgi:hypothetical protein